MIFTRHITGKTILSIDNQTLGYDVVVCVSKWKYIHSTQYPVLCGDIFNYNVKTFINYCSPNTCSKKTLLYIMGSSVSIY